MITRSAFQIAASALALGLATIGCTHQGDAVASVGDAAAPQSSKAAVQLAAKAEKLLAKGKVPAAVAAAEAAVAASSQDATHRALLGRAYLAAGRFASAESALRDSLTLDPSQGRVALSLALAQTAQGRWSEARETLNQHQATIAPVDRGLAFALAGDPVLAVDILTNAARGPDADAQTRQNLALALALAGRWPEAQAIASQDVAPQDVHARLKQWAQFSQPKDAADQVASLLGVTPAFDGGMPAQLALAPSAPAQAAVEAAPAVEVAVVEPQPEAVLAEVVPIGAVPAEIAPVEAAPVVADQVAAAVQAASVTFLPRQEIVQAVPASVAPVIAAEKAPVRVAAATPAARPAQGKGRYAVQLGAFDTTGVAQERWQGAVRRHKQLGDYAPSTMTIGGGKGAGLVRLSVAGFASERDAAQLCGSLKAAGQGCFVRMVASDAPVAWGNRRLASR